MAERQVRSILPPGYVFPEQPKMSGMPQNKPIQPYPNAKTIRQTIEELALDIKIQWAIISRQLDRIMPKDVTRVILVTSGRSMDLTMVAKMLVDPKTAIVSINTLPNPELADKLGSEIFVRDKDGHFQPSPSRAQKELGMK